jgi:formylmethanofuran dehydrogenase subunit E-like metal-binding protein
VAFFSKAEGGDMKTRKRWISLMVLVGLAFTAGHAWAGIDALRNEAARALNQAMAKLNNPTDPANIVCLTNAGYAMYQGESTLNLCKTVRDVCGVSMDTGNILRVHTDLDAPLYFALAHKTGPDTLPLVLVSQEDISFTVSEILDAYVKKGISVETFKSLGPKSFSVVSIANGWANDFPEDLMQAALYHDHLCAGVSTGFLTVNFIRKHLPLAANQRYTYIGAPAWCQDDYIVTALNLTPGKRGYLAMRFPWSEVWKTAEKEYAGLGGMVIRYDAKTGKGDATLLKFDWRREAFAEFVSDPGMDVKQKGNPLLHVYYSRFFLADKDHPEKFVSVMAAKSINGQAELDRLTAMGANPLEEMLGNRVTEEK